MRKISVALALVLIFGCASAPVTTSRGILEDTKIVILAQELVGAQVFVNQQPLGRLEKNDLQKYRFGVMGVRNSERENLQAFSISVPSGMVDLRLVKGGRVIMNRQIFMSEGQIKELIVENEDE